MFKAQARAAEEGHDGPAGAGGPDTFEVSTLVPVDRVRTVDVACAGRAAPGLTPRGVREFVIAAV